MKLRICLLLILPAWLWAIETTIIRPVADLEVPDGGLVQFEAAASDLMPPPAGNPSFQWWIVNQATGANASFSGKTIEYTFRGAGTWTVRCSASQTYNSYQYTDLTPALRLVTVIAVNQPPQGQIVAPVADTTLDVGDYLRFEAQGTDPENQALVFRWDVLRPDGGSESELGRERNIRFVQPGLHRVRLTTSDALGAIDPNRPERLVTVRSGDNAPETTIVQPLAGSVFPPGQDIAFAATSDAGGVQFLWEIHPSNPSSAPRTFSGDSPVIGGFAEGQYTAYCRAQSTEGLADPSPASVVFEVRGFQVQVVEPASPTLAVEQGSITTFRATVVGGSAPLQFQWYLQGQGVGGALEWQHQWSSAGTYGVEFQATDAQGQRQADWLLVEVRPQAGQLQILEPLDGQEIALGTSFRLRAGVPASAPGDLQLIWLLEGRTWTGGEVEGVQLTSAGASQLELIARSAAGLWERRSIVLQGFDQNAQPRPIMVDPASDVILEHQQRVFLNGSASNIRPGQNAELVWIFRQQGQEPLYTWRGAMVGWINAPALSGDFELLLQLYLDGRPSGEILRKIQLVAPGSRQFQDNTSIERAGKFHPGFYSGMPLDRPRYFSCEWGADLFTMHLEVELTGAAQWQFYRMEEGNPRLLSSAILPGSTTRLIPKLPAATYILAFLPPPDGKRDLSFGVGIRVLKPALFLPDAAAGAGETCTLGLINPGTLELEAEAVAFALDGTLLARNRKVLPPGARALMSTAAWFPGVQDRVAWVRVDADGPLSGYALKQSHDRLEWAAMPAVRQGDEQLIIPHVAQKTEQWYTRSCFANVAETSGSSLLVLGEGQVDLRSGAGYAADQFDFLDKFGGNLPAGNGWGHAQAGGALLAGSEIFGKVDGNRQAGGLALEPPRAANPNFFNLSSSLYFSHIARDTAQFWTGLALVNVGSGSASARLKAWGPGGVLVSERELLLAEQGKMLGLAQDFLGPETPQEQVDWLEIISEDDLTGYELFGTHDEARLAALEAITTLDTNLVFPHLDPPSGAWYGVALVNVGEQGQRVELLLRAADGQVLASVQRDLAAHEKLVLGLAELFGPLPDQAAWVQAVGQQPLIGFELFGTPDNQSMAALRAE